MRIISGKLKGKSINYLKNEKTRPLKDSVKESIFNILTHSNSINLKIKNANVLDLYSGIGSFGLECISREAKHVTFVEEDLKAVQILEKNLKNMSIFDKAKIINNKIENINFSNNLLKFDIIFLDPPFKDHNFLKNIENMKKKKIYNKNNILIIHREKNSNDNLEKFCNLILFRQYGRSKIIFAKLI
tara:strand:+ start:126 stop:686 length:561 start_codon:yes stop_codon:yes gene_type:complete